MLNATYEYPGDGTVIGYSRAYPTVGKFQHHDAHEVQRRLTHAILVHEEGLARASAEEESHVRSISA